MSTPEYTSKDVSRFWSKVNKDGSIPAHLPELGACWEWTGSCKNNGYGQFSVRSSMVGTHRFAWELIKGGIPAGLHVLHSCDNRACCNPDHLFLGTQLDNMRDMANKHRTKNAVLHGEKNGNHKLTVEKVAEIRMRYASGGITQAQLAIETGMSNQQISSIVNNKSWR